MATKTLKLYDLLELCKNNESFLVRRIGQTWRECEIYFSIKEVKDNFDNEDVFEIWYDEESNIVFEIV